MIRFEQVTKRLGGRIILDDITYEIERGETFAIVGASGSGKSVSLKHMVRLLTPDSGRIWVGDDCISEASGAELDRIRNRFGFLFQGSALMQWLNVADNVGLPLTMKSELSEEEVDDEVKKRLDMVNLGDAFEKHPNELSGGMRKRVGLARAIITNPEIILYDEPTSGLDPVTSRTIDRLIDHLRTELGVTSVVVTHDLHSALAIATRIGMLHNGKMVEIATPADFIKSKNDEVQRFLEAQYITSRGDWEKADTV